MGAKFGARRAWKLLKIYLRMDLLQFLKDTRVCLIYIFSDGIISLSSVVGMLLLVRRLGPAAGMPQNELMFMLSCALLVNGVYSLLFTNNNAGAISRIIGRGQLDHALIQPVPLPVHFMVNGVAPFSGCGPLLVALGMTIWSAGGWSCRHFGGCAWPACCCWR